MNICVITKEDRILKNRSPIVIDIFAFYFDSNKVYLWVILMNVPILPPTKVWEGRFWLWRSYNAACKLCWTTRRLVYDTDYNFPVK